MSDPIDYLTLPPDLAAAFARRVAERDTVPPPSQTPAAIAGRVSHWLLTTHHARDTRSRPALTRLVLHLLAQPEASTETLAAVAGLGPRMTVRHLGRLQALGLTEWASQRQTRYHRLTRAAEDALVPVVTGVG